MNNKMSPSSSSLKNATLRLEHIREQRKEMNRETDFSSACEGAASGPALKTATNPLFKSRYADFGFAWRR